MAVIGAGSGSGYPAAIDTSTAYTNGTPALTDDSTRADAELANDVEDAIVKIETELGINPKGGYASVVARLNAIVAGALSVTSQAAGDLLAASSASQFVRLAVGGADTVIQGGTTPAYTATPLVQTLRAKSATASVRLIGTEGSAKDVQIVEAAGLWYFQRNDGTEGSPSWITMFYIDLGSGAFNVVGALNQNLQSTSRVILPVGSNKYAT